MTTIAKLCGYATAAMVGGLVFYRALVAQLSPEDRTVDDVLSSPFSFRSDYTSDNRFLEDRFDAGLDRAHLKTALEGLRIIHGPRARLFEDKQGLNFELLMPPLAAGGQMSMTARFSFDAAGRLSGAKWIRRDLYRQVQS